MGLRRTGEILNNLGYLLNNGVTDRVAAQIVDNIQTGVNAEVTIDMVNNFVARANQDFNNPPAGFLINYGVINAEAVEGLPLIKFSNINFGAGQNGDIEYIIGRTGPTGPYAIRQIYYGADGVAISAEACTITEADFGANQLFENISPADISDNWLETILEASLRTADHQA